MKTIEEQERHLNMTIKVLKEQVEVFTSQLEPHDTGHIHTTIYTLKHRIGELEDEKRKTDPLSLFNDAQMLNDTFEGDTISQTTRLKEIRKAYNQKFIR